MNAIGTMQGRLSPPSAGRIQSFPSGTWREEFPLAQRAGLACIEWIYEADTEAANPLGTEEGVSQIREAEVDSGIGVRSVCADYYMERRLVTPGGTPDPAAVQHLKWLVGRAGLLDIRYIVLPFVDASSLKTAQEVDGMVCVLQAVLPAAEQVGVELHLETDLKPADLVAVLERVSHPRLKANYDMGNSASLGYDPEEELTLLKPWLGSVHVKDRVLGGGTVSLGTGSTNFSTCFRLIAAAGFQGPFILQAAREEGPNEVELAVRNRRFVEMQQAGAKREAG